MHGYLFKSYANRANPEYIPSLIGIPTNGASAQPAYYERVDVPDRAIIGMTKTHYVVEASDNDPILQVRHPKGLIYYIPLSELEEVAAENSDDDTFAMLRLLFKGRTF